MEDVVTWLLGNLTEKDYVIMITDSLNLVSKIERGQMQKVWLPLCASSAARIWIIYIPSHAGIHLNEIYNKLHVAGAAGAFGELACTDGDIINTVTEVILGKEEPEDSTVALKRVREKVTVLGDGARVYLRRESRRSTQHLTGTMSVTGLISRLELLEGSQQG